MGYSSSDSLDHQSLTAARSNRDSSGLTTTPKLSSVSGAKTEISSMDASISRTSSSREADRSGELSISNVSDIENEWVEQDEPGVYITIKALPGGLRELRRVRFRNCLGGSCVILVGGDCARIHKLVIMINRILLAEDDFNKVLNAAMRTSGL
ncbi:Brevis radix-like protein 4 [Tanacetum coccineum]